LTTERTTPALPCDRTVDRLREAFRRCLADDPYLGGLSVAFVWKVPGGGLPLGALFGPDGEAARTQDLELLLRGCAATVRLAVEQGRMVGEALAAADAFANELAEKLRGLERTIAGGEPPAAGPAGGDR
jgi:hypothetical protein